MVESLQISLQEEHNKHEIKVDKVSMKSIILSMKSISLGLSARPGIWVYFD